jgi:hypothetical protein
MNKKAVGNNKIKHDPNETKKKLYIYIYVCIKNNDFLSNRLCIYIYNIYMHTIIRVYS